MTHEEPMKPHRYVMTAYSGEHGIYGIVLTTSLLVVGWEQETDFELIFFVVGTVFVFWLAHLYAAVVAARSTDAGRTLPVWPAIKAAARRSAGMMVATLGPVAFLLLGVLDVFDEDTAYNLALASGVVILALIGWFNAARNEGSVAQRFIGLAITASFGLLMIGLSILIH